MESPLHYFSSLTVPRVERTREHELTDILSIRCFYNWVRFGFNSINC
jgi:hypothetical protein